MHAILYLCRYSLWILFTKVDLVPHIFKFILSAPVAKSKEMHCSPWFLLKRLHTKCFPWIRRGLIFIFSPVYILPPPKKKVAATKIDWPVPLVCHMLILNVYCNGYNYPSPAQGPEPLHPFITTKKSVVCIFDWLPGSRSFFYYLHFLVTKAFTFPGVHKREQQMLRKEKGT